MNLENTLKLSYYKELADVDEKHGVKLVQHTESGKIFVLKTLKIYDKSVFDFIASNNLPGVPHIEEMVEDDETLYIIEEYISGRTIGEIIQNSGSLSEREAISYITELCQILEPFHAQKPPIVNRDIKPANLILDPKGKLFLVDFNSAKEKGDAYTDTTPFGTVGYAAPEQYGFSESNPATDIYAIGVLLNEMLTGHMPNKGLYEGNLRPVIDKCMQMDPKNRYSSVQELKSALEKIAPLYAKTREEIYSKAITDAESSNLKDLKKAKESFESLGDYQDSEEHLSKITLKIESAEIEHKAKKKKAIRLSVLLVLVLLFSVGGYFAYNYYYIPLKINTEAYNKAVALYDNEDYLEANKAFLSISDFKDSDVLADESLEKAYDQALTLRDESKYEEAYKIFEGLGEYKDSAEQKYYTYYVKAEKLFDSGDYENAIKAYTDAGSKYKEQISLCYYEIGRKNQSAGNYEEALEFYKKAGNNYKKEQADCNFLLGEKARDNEEYHEAIRYYEKCKGYEAEFEGFENILLECKYQYIVSVPDDSETSDYKKYLKDLSGNEQYSAKVSDIYKEVFAWKVELVAVNNSQFSLDNYNEIAMTSPVCVHARLAGGDGGKIRVSVSYYLPAGIGDTMFIGDKSTYLEAGADISIIFYYTFNPIPGLASWTYYNADTGESIGSGSITMY